LHFSWQHELPNRCDQTGQCHCRIIAKIADSQGLKNIDTILEVCSGVVISRGDLGLEIGPEKVALAQNLCVSKAKVRGKV
jgi:pyruvate kinase